MYEKFFDFKIKPFELVPNPSMLYPSRAHQKVLNYLDYGFKEGAGFILLTGEVGSGKTTLIRNLIKDLDRNVVRAMIFNTMVRPKQLLAMINEEFGLDPAGKDKVSLLRELNDFLVDKYANRCRAMLIIDEAQNLSVEALEEIRLLSNLELDAAKLMQIILVGQPELKELLEQSSLRQLRQRISINCHLRALERDETEAYVYHRMEMAGNREAVNFAEGVFDVLHEQSGGIPRIINVFCDFILLSAFVEGTHDVSLDLVRDVLEDLTFDEPARKAKAAQPAPTQEELSDLSLRVKQLEDTQEEILALHADNQAIRSRLSNHENIIRKVVKAQQNQIKRLDQSLVEINSKLESLVQEHYRLNEGAGPLPIRVVEAGRVTSSFWNKQEQ